jgi:hypothetical protein
LVRAALARRIATPVAKSPCATSRLRSIAGSGGGAAPSVPGWQSRERVQYELFDAIFQALNSISIDFGRIDVEGPAQRTRPHEFRELVDPLGEESLQCPTNRRLDEELRAMPARAPRHRGGRRAEEANRPAAQVGCRGFGRVQEVEGIARELAHRRAAARGGRRAASARAPLLKGQRCKPS